MEGLTSAYMTCPTYSLSGPFINPMEDRNQSTISPRQRQQRTMETSSSRTEKPPPTVIEVDVSYVRNLCFELLNIYKLRWSNGEFFVSNQPNPGDDKSVFGNASLASGLTSVASTIPNFMFENGRRYHSLPGKYVRFPLALF